MQMEFDMNLEHSKVCSHCNERKSLDDFRLKNRGHYHGYDHRCRDCEDGYHKELRELKKSIPPKPDACECCGTVAELQLDHDHVELKHRGWICKSCNVRVGIVERSGKEQPAYIYDYIDGRK
jgi:hypothetical protein